MKILLVNTFYYPDVYGGAEISVQKLAENLNQKFNDVSVLATSTSSTCQDNDGIKVIKIKINNIYDTIKVKNKRGILKVIYKIIDLYNVFNYSIIKKIIEEIKPQIIHTNNLYGISPIIWKIAKKQNIKIVHTVRDYQLICPIVNFKCQNGECKLKKMCNLYRTLRIRNCKNVDEVVFISETIKNIFEDLGYFQNANKKVIYNAIDFNLNDVNKIISDKINNDKSIINLVYIGTLDYHKGIDLLIEAFNELDINNVRLRIAGKGNLEKYVIEKCKENEDIVFDGFIDQENLQEYLELQDVLIAPSRWIEPFGRVVLDAYKAGMPVIASNQGGFKETVIDNFTGILFENNNKESLKRAIVKICNNETRERYLNNISHELSKYNINNHSQEYLKVYGDSK